MSSSLALSAARLGIGDPRSCWHMKNSYAMVGAHILPWCSSCILA
jgi:hypothetical protein